MPAAVLWSMAVQDKPVIRVLVGWYCEPWGLIGAGRIVDLEEALECQQLGAWLFVDPGDECDFATWERLQYNQRGRKS